MRSSSYPERHIISLCLLLFWALFRHVCLRFQTDLIDLGAVYVCHVLGCKVQTDLIDMLLGRKSFKHTWYIWGPYLPSFFIAMSWGANVSAAPGRFGGIDMFWGASIGPGRFGAVDMLWGARVSQGPGRFGGRAPQGSLLTCFGLQSSSVCRSSSFKLTWSIRGSCLPRLWLTCFGLQGSSLTCLDI